MATPASRLCGRPTPAPAVGDAAVLHALTGRVVVVKYGGAAMTDDAAADAWAADVGDLVASGTRVVVVHGGGPALTRTLARLGIESTFIDGHRVTCADTAEIADMVLSGRINGSIVSRLQRAGVRAVGLSGTDGGLVTVRPHRPGGRDLGFVGEPAGVDSEVLELLLARGWVPVVAPTAIDGTGQVFNINADLVAGAVAAALAAARLVFLSDVPGLVISGRTVGTVTREGAVAVLDSGDASGGMRPKLGAALYALDEGVDEVVLADGRAPHALMAALVTGGAATRIVAGGDP